MSKDLIISKFKKHKVYGIQILPKNHPARKCGHVSLPIIIQAISILEAKKAMDEYVLEVFKWVIINNLDFSASADNDPFEILKEFQEDNNE